MIPLLIDILNYVKSFQITFFYTLVVLLSFLIGKEIREKILKAYFSVMVVISAVSLIYFVINLLFWESGGVANFISPLYKREAGSILVYPMWSVYDLKSWYFPRNMSIFFEPGAFAFHLIICIMLSFKYYKIKLLIIFIAAALTTFSTTMYLSLFFIFLYAVFYRGFRIMKPKYVVMVLILFVTIFSRLQSEGQNWNFLNMVRMATIEKFNPSSSSYNSMSGRMSYSYAALDMYLNSIILGNGHYSSEYMLDFDQMAGHATTTSSLFGLPAELGVFGIFCIFLYVQFFKSFKLFAVPITFLWLNGEFMAYTIFMIFILTHQSDLFFNYILYKKYNNFTRLPKQFA
jgi:hypothetical protein